ncbi:MAG: hypothetical protein MAG795_00249 [Candidatus Woesearchaeota archaeon]|nr:hypothetical protein [Candidatus Woesearchaeota archaeon]
MMNKLLLLTTLLILFIMPVSVLALPNSDTSKSGDVCEREHSFNYNYNFNYDKELEINKEYQLELSFSISGSKITRNPYKVSIELEPNGFELSQNSISLSQGNKIIGITPIKKDASIIVNTKLVLDGDASQHRGYKATYKDKFTLDQFFIYEPKTKSKNTKSNNLSIVPFQTYHIQYLRINKSFQTS